MLILNLILFNVFVILNAEYTNGAGKNASEAIAGELSKRKCKEYSQHASSKSECERLREDLLLGTIGQFAHDKDYPHMVMLGRKRYGYGVSWEWLCGGSLISEQFVLTVAHCLTGRLGIPEFIRAGVTNISDVEHSQDIKIQEIIVHPEFKDPYNDIGLVKLEKELHINPNVLPACLHTQPEVNSPQAIHSGWGPSEFVGPWESRLQEERLNFYNESTCNKTFKRSIGERLKNGIVSETMICAGSGGSRPSLNRDTLRSGVMIRSGAALQINNKEYDCIMYDIVGISSFGIALVTSIPSIFTRVSAYVPWIEEKVWK